MRTPAAPVVSPWSPGPDADFEGFLSRLVPKTRASVDKHVDASAATDTPGYGPLWKRLAVLMSKLAPHAIEVSGAVLRFYIADGKYRRQVFALEEERAGRIQIYLPDVIAAALQRGILGKPKELSYPVLAMHGVHLEMDTVSADSKEIPDYCKGMLGWGRRALRINLATSEAADAIHAVESLCQVAAEAWAQNAATLTTPTTGAA